MKYTKTDINHPFLEILECCGENTEVNQPVEELYYLGRLPDPRPPVVAIVGARRCTQYGEEAAYRAAYDLAKKGVVIVSGMAYGIDACAHRGCLDAGGVTVAVLGTPIDKIYPRGNASLAKRILERGAIISEYAPGFPTKAYCFQERNRIVSGLADFLLVIEASRQSGTKGTFDMACKQGKEVFVLPGDITRPMSAGSNEMLRAGAHPYLDSSDILIRYGDGLHESLGPDLSALNELEHKVYAAIKVGYDNADDIVKALDISACDFNIAVTTLELYDLVSLQGNNWVAK